MTDLRPVLFAFALGLLAADATYTPAQIVACRPDALRWCAAHVGNDPAMRACMVAHWAQLSQQCREAFK